MSNSIFYDVCRLEDIWEGDMEFFEVGGKAVLIVHTEEGKIRAFDAICPHQEMSLEDGDFEDCVITCPVHQWQFDGDTGQGVNPEGVSLTRYEALVEDGMVKVAFG